MAAIYSLYIINKSGGLIFYKDYGSAGRMDTNDSLRVASLWHSMHAISQQLSPVSGCFGIELLQADTFDLHCFQSLTGTKFFVVSEPGTQHMEDLLKSIYELYTDYVLKNPFYEMEMPIRKIVMAAGRFLVAWECVLRENKIGGLRERFEDEVL
ncbi:uncharacterized protein LOC133788329 isoform X3 [Humulus lupulus]|uniref:uncharacterized protein LOC133788329 isoform X3 n=1 Tax=Humulus lupulus TaxID=3486 RepID=UPI002B4113F4|nr:uncharacterized protein LOC133788329 isoform X3 [Humulus lupulus]